MNKLGISPDQFYGKKTPQQDKIEAILKKHDSVPTQPKYMSRLLGPSQTWKIFKKQQDCIECCLQRRNGLMAYAFEDVNSRRMFLAAHPKVFWALNSHRFFKNCSSYEIIREFSACKLYLDIEFEYAYNKGRDGNKMLENLLHIICVNLKEYFKISCGRERALNLDSSSETKFSHHVIYVIDDVAFQDNYAVGNFVKKICEELREAYENNLSGDNSKLQTITQKYNLNDNDVLELFISDRKNQIKLFVDEGVYTKNRHFRLLGSSKQAKNIPLKVSDLNRYKPSGGTDLDYFLDSLITYFSGSTNRILNFDESPSAKSIPATRHSSVVREPSHSDIYPQIDSFITQLISPYGRIRRKVFFSDSSTIVYDISGFRYCDNIRREHKSNNIKYIVDLGSLGYYQKCYDPDCLEFRSCYKRLPEEICTLFEADDFLSNAEELPDEELGKIVDEIEKESQFEDVVDEDLERMMDVAEAVLGIDW